MSNIRALPKRSTVNPKVVELLEEMLGLAKEGTITAFAATVMFNDGKPGSYAEANVMVAQLIGNLAVLSHQLCQQVVDKSGEPPMPTGGNDEQPSA